jgi:hypothetical protein
MMTTGPTLDDFICGGYYVAKIPHDYKKTELIPDGLVAVSTCVTETLPDTWAIAWVKSSDKQRREAAQNCGLGPDQLARFIAWTTEKLDKDSQIGWPNVLLSLGTAKELVETFAVDLTAFRLLGIGLHREQADEVIEHLRPKAPHVGEDGLLKGLRKRQPLAAGGRFLGYDLLGTEIGGSFHSWFCNGLEKDIWERCRIRPNAFGLIDTWSAALECAQYAGDRKTGAEPGKWNAWVVVNY